MVVALGTHQGMDETHLARHLGYPVGAADRTYPGWMILNHESWLPDTFTSLGSIGAERLTELTGGLMTDTSVEVRINRHVAEADVAIVVGPVFPHEVVGFSGGNKYFFPGVSGPELINLSHWVGALITSAEMIGTRGVTPVRALVNEAATLIPADGWRCAWWWPPAPTPCTRSPSAPPKTPGRPRPRCRPRPTSPTATVRSGGCCRSCRPSTRTSGPPRKASTSSSRSSPTAVR